MIYYMNGSQCYDKQSLFDLFCRITNPGYEINNLDALWDYLTETDASFYITGGEHIANQVGDYGQRFLGLFLMAQEENPNLRVTIQ